MNRDRFWLTDAQFARIERHLPTDTRGKPRVDDRRVISGIEYLSSLPRGTGPLGFYEDEAERVAIGSIRLASELPAAAQPKYEYMKTHSASFAKYADARANRRDPFFIKPAGGADICNIPVPIRAVAAGK